MEQGKGEGGQSKLRILFYVAALNGGGAEKHLVRIINQIDRGRFEPILVLARSGGAYDRCVRRDVRTVVLHRSAFLPVCRKLRAAIRHHQPRVVFSLLDPSNIQCLIATRCLARRPKVIVGVQNTPSMAYRGPWWSRRRILMALMSTLYPAADCVVASSRAVRGDLRSLSPAAARRCQVIHNAGYDESVLEGATELAPEIRGDGPLLVGCGRLTKQKGFPQLLEALAMLRQSVPARLCLVGEGPDRCLLQEQVRSLRLRDSVDIVGFQSNPFRFMAAADVFVLSSLWEGFGNVIVESMACGTPVVATSCRSGPDEIIEDRVNGMLVPPDNPRALADALTHLLTDTGLYRRLRENGKRRARDFSVESITRRYEQLFVALADEQPSTRAAAVPLEAKT